MGDYTEMVFRADIVCTAKEVGDLSRWFSAFAIGREVPPFADHEFFRADRWQALLAGSSAYHPTSGPSVRKVVHDTPYFQLALHSSFKNYDDELTKFLSWIHPYVEEMPRRFLGYVLPPDRDWPSSMIMGSDGIRVVHP